MPMAIPTLGIFIGVNDIFFLRQINWLTMNIEEVRDYCLSLPYATEDFPFDETTLVFRVENKIFAMVDLVKTEWFVLKCDPEYAIELREEHVEISGAWHMNKKYWNQINLLGSLPEKLIKDLIRHSYNEVVKKLPKKVSSGRLFLLD